jgi:hypothetical protein
VAKPPTLTDVIGLTKPKKPLGRPRGRGDRITLTADTVDELKTIAGVMQTRIDFKPTVEQVIQALITHYNRMEP